MIKEIQFKEGEELIMIVRRYLLTYFWQILIAFILVILPFFLLYPLFRWGKWGIGIFVALIIIAIIFCLRVFLVWYWDSFVITNKRVIDVDQRGFFSRTVAQAQLVKIQDAAYSKKGFFQTLFKYGNIIIQTAGAEARLEMKNIHHPQEVQELINNLHKEAVKSEKASEAEKIDKIPSVKNKVLQGINRLDDEEIEEIYEVVKKRVE